MDNWQRLSDEINQSQITIGFWWRDDDAVADTPALQKMLNIARDNDLPVHLAVIPMALEHSLSIIKAPHNSPISYVLQHGVEHKSYALSGQRKIELGGSQAVLPLVTKLSTGHQLLSQRFAGQYLSILVPPWNRISSQVAEKLPQVGYKKLSVLHSQKRVESNFELNVHIDIINWQQRAFAGEEVVLDKIIRLLANRRLSVDVSTKPIGLMTHHLDHDKQCWDFICKFFKFCREHPKIQWVSGEALYQH
jgi:hypothetical protein